MQHRWSGWPGAWCLDCGCDDAVELSLADGYFEPMTVADLRRLYPNHPGIEECKEPGSNRHNPYVK